jgi:hypothetical protein
MTARARFRQADVTKAVIGAMAAGLTPSRVCIEPDGTITLEFGAPQPQNAYDRWKREQNALAVELV